jgi:hypothetical protein
MSWDRQKKKKITISNFKNDYFLQHGKIEKEKEGEYMYVDIYR